MKLPKKAVSMLSSNMVVKGPDRQALQADISVEREAHSVESGPKRNPMSLTRHLHSLDEYILLQVLNLNQALKVLARLR